MKQSRTRVGIFGGCLALAACATHAPSPTVPAAAAIQAVLEQDSKLGKVRNHAPESEPVAESLRAYVQGLDAIDFSDCPADFTRAFERHRNAWHESIRYLEQHAEMRGELHDLFDQIRGLSADARMQVERIEKDIWDTWAEVEAAVNRHGAGSN